MTRTISINLGGLLFHIDDQAYDTLQSYLSAIEKQFKDEREKKDIMTDIELRVSELFSERINRQKDLITGEDVSAVIQIMGEPHDFIEEDESAPQTKKERKKSRSKRMYRDPDNRMLGGVCSGLGSYFNLDPWFFRSLFILFTIFFLAGFIIYIILWVTIPEAVTTAQKLEMRGEAVTIESIKNTVKQEFDNVRKKMNF